MLKRLIYYTFEKIKIKNRPLFNLNFYRKISYLINKKLWRKYSESKKIKSIKLNVLEKQFITNGYCKIPKINEGSLNKFLCYLNENFDLTINDELKKSQIEIVKYQQLNQKKLLEFLRTAEIHKILRNYIGYDPMLFGASVIGTNPTKNNSGSQLFHFDNIEEKSIRVILLLSDVCQENGPTTIIKKDKSSEIADAVNYYKRKDYASIMDEEFDIREEDKIHLTGKKGDVFLLDTFACLHSGGRTNKGQRLVFMATVGKGLFTNLRWMYKGKYDYGTKI